jgi:hypothetical protein
MVSVYTVCTSIIGNSYRESVLAAIALSRVIFHRFENREDRSNLLREVQFVLASYLGAFVAKVIFGLRVWNADVECDLRKIAETKIGVVAHEFILRVSFGEFVAVGSVFVRMTLGSSTESSRHEVGVSEVFPTEVATDQVEQFLRKLVHGRVVRFRKNGFGILRDRSWQVAREKKRKKFGLTLNRLLPSVMRFSMKGSHNVTFTKPQAAFATQDTSVHRGSAIF